MTRRHAIHPARRTRFSRTGSAWLGLAAALACAAGLAAQDDHREQMKGLDEQVQEIKSDVLGIAAELNVLEEKLLYPSGTHLALFVALEDGAAVRLDSVQVALDGEPVARYIYSYQELEALRKGGAQRLYTGNIATGAHRLEVSVMGKHEGGADFSENGQFSIDKGVGPKLVGITLAGSGAGRPTIAVGDW